ncbi:Hypp1856 [Branchiostoma lanceolatum]|uniref:Hypp1856 protein n=1 Tax=Branchiostoma lanceolatum TaxID=7740 RepID=A0A8J9ZLE3_BRALA|nr:Hypp1856 [Branchiostoma lanceolatum]
MAAFSNNFVEEGRFSSGVCLKRDRPLTKTYHHLTDSLMSKPLFSHKRVAHPNKQRYTCLLSVGSTPGVHLYLLKSWYDVSRTGRRQTAITSHHANKEYKKHSSNSFIIPST